MQPPVCDFGITFGDLPFDRCFYLRNAIDRNGWFSSRGEHETLTLVLTLYVVIDFAGSDPQVPGFVNSVATNTYSNIYTALVALFPDLPVNSGYFRPFTINLPGHSVVNCGPPAPVGYSTVCIGSDICEAVMKAFEDICPDLVGAADIDIGSIRESYVFVIECLERQEVGSWTARVSRCGFRRRAG